MEVSLIKESTDGSTRDAEIVSKSSHGQQIVLANNHEQGTHKCDHFSIRGYVAEVRKRETKLCCPLFKSHNRTRDEHPNLVPPLVVKKFRQWNCQNCLHEITVTEAARGNGTSMNIENDQVNEYHSLTGNTMAASQPSAKSIVSLPQEPEENFLERRIAEKDSSVHGSRGISVPRSGDDRDHEDKGCSSQPLSVATEGEASQGGNIVVRSKTSEAAIKGKHMIDIVSSNRKDNGLVHGVGDAGISKKVTSSMGFNVAISDQRDDQGLSETITTKDSHKNVVKGLRMPRKDVAVRSPYDNFNCLDSSHEEIDTTIGFTGTMVHTQDDIVYPPGSGERLQNKRPPKMRSIDDIMKSEDLCKASIPSEGARIQGNGKGKGKGNPEKISIIRGDGVSGNHHGKTDALNIEERNLDHRSELVTENAEPKPNRKKKFPSDSDGPCISHYLNKFPRKRKSHKRDTKAKHINTEAGKCDSGAMVDFDLNLKLEDVQEICDKKTPSSKKKNKKPLIEDGASSQMPKNHSIQLPREEEEKHKNMGTSEQQEEDDIPMDIVELLAKSRQEKLLMDDMADNGSTHNLSMMTGSVNDDKRSHMVDREEHYSSSKKILDFDLNQEVPISASMDSQGFLPSTDPSLSGSQRGPNRNFSPQDACWNNMETLALHSDPINRLIPCHNPLSFGHNGSSVLLNGTGFGNLGPNFGPNDLHWRGTSKAVKHINACYQTNKGESSINEGRTFPIKLFAVAVNGNNPEKVYPMDIDTNESMTATSLLRLMDQNAGSGEPCHSAIYNVNMGSEVGVRSTEGTKLPRVFESSVRDQQVNNPTIPFRPVARVGGVGPLLQREIAISSNNSMSSFGFPLKTNAVGRGDALHFSAASRDVISKGTDYSIDALSHTRSSVTRNRVVPNNKNNAFQPVRGTPRMEKCVLNRNPADFTMIGEDNEYMIGYKERRPQPRKVQSPSNPKGRKRQKVMTVNNLNGSNWS